MTSKYALQILASKLQYHRTLPKTQQATDWVHKWHEHITHGYVAFSGGKDSSVLLDIIMRHYPKTPVVWLVDYPIAHQIEHLASVEQFYGIKILRVWLHDWAHSEWQKIYQDPIKLPHNLQIDESRYPTLQTFAQAYQFDGVALGLRKDESRNRRIILAQKTPLYKTQYDELWHINPLFNWSTDDVWSYLAHHNIPIHPAYQDMTENGIPLNNCRIDGFTNVRHLRFGYYSTLRRLWANHFNEFASLNPCIKKYL